MDFLKNSVIALAGATGATALAHRQLSHRFPHGYVRAVNYHGTPRRTAANLDAHFQYLAERYTSVGPVELAAMLAGQWRSQRPGVLICFDDGLRSNSETAAPLLDKHGLTGWFFLPAGLIEAASGGRGDQRALAANHRVRVNEEDRDPVFMDWSLARTLAERHVIGCHTMDHTRLPPGESPAVLQRAIPEAKSLMENRLQRAVQSFCWVGGEPEHYSRDAAYAIKAAGFQYAFMSPPAPIVAGTDPLQLHRTPLDPRWSFAWVHFYLSGIMDAVRARRRRRVDRMTA